MSFTMASATAISLLFIATASAFAPTSHQTIRAPLPLYATATPDVVVISPPGGIGEIASIETARNGGSVKWFVVSSSSSSDNNLSLTADSLAAIQAAGGSIEFAGADAQSLVFADEESSNSATAAVAAWCSGSKAVLCTYDGAEEEGRRADRATLEATKDNNKGDDTARMIKSGVRVAAREAANVAASGATKVVALYSGDEMVSNENKEEKKGFLQDLFGKNAKAVPDTLADAMGDVSVVRYGELFGAPESSPESSPFVGGPRAEPIIRDMYTMRSIRIDPTISVSGNILSGGSKSNRLAIGSSLTRLATKKVTMPTNINSIDVALSSYPGTDAPTDEEWNTEFSRALTMISSPTGGATLFTAEFASVPSTSRLAEWIATKWAPAILRSYEIAGIRVGARPVYATHSNNVVELVWQDLVDFNPVKSGKMTITVDENGMVASRGAGDPSAGFGKISMKPLPGEDILVRRLADAAAQAVEKGLAVKSKEKTTTKEQVTTKSPVLVEAPKTVETPTLMQQQEAASSDAGPRSSGVRRSSERTRGKKRKDSPSTGSFE